MDSSGIPVDSKIPVEFQWHSSGIRKASGIPVEYQATFSTAMEFQWNTSELIPETDSTGIPVSIFQCQWNSNGIPVNLFQGLEFQWNIYHAAIVNMYFSTSEIYI